MPKFKLIHLLLPFLLLALTILSSCKEEDPLPVLGCTDTGAVNFDANAEISDGNCVYPDFQVNFNYHVNRQPFHFDSVYLLGSGNHWVKLSVVKFYTSNYELESETGTSTSLSNSVVLSSPGTRSYKVGKTRVGDYNRLTFNVGIDANNNTRLPSDFPVGHPLNSSEMYNPAQGFLFVKVRGVVDTDFDGLFSYPVELDLGMIDLLRTQSFDVDLDIKDQDIKNNEVTINIDMAKLFESIDLSVDYSINYLDNPSLADKAMNDFIAGMSKE